VAAREIFRLLDNLLYELDEKVRDRAIQKLLEIRHVVQNEDKEHIMRLTMKLAHDEDENNRVSALKIMNDFSQDMGQTLTECFIVPEINSLGIDESVNVRIAVAKNLLNVSKIVSFDFFKMKIFPLYNTLTQD
jgi:HEAT repeat protein